MFRRSKFAMLRRARMDAHHSKPSKEVRKFFVVIPRKFRTVFFNQPDESLFNFVVHGVGEISFQVPFDNSAWLRVSVRNNIYVFDYLINSRLASHAWPIVERSRVQLPRYIRRQRVAQKMVGNSTFEKSGELYCNTPSSFLAAPLPSFQSSASAEWPDAK